ncbi:hypothetical protein HZS_5131 [Henneguya salminicola]|nr:hypothetical protein HZS_5131 [Henneguya salminicola]
MIISLLEHSEDRVGEEALKVIHELFENKRPTINRDIFEMVSRMIGENLKKNLDDLQFFNLTPTKIKNNELKIKRIWKLVSINSYALWFINSNWKIKMDKILSFDVIDLLLKQCQSENDTNRQNSLITLRRNVRIINENIWNIIQKEKDLNIHKNILKNTISFYALMSKNHNYSIQRAAILSLIEISYMHTSNISQNCNKIIYDILRHNCLDKSSTVRELSCWGLGVHAFSQPMYFVGFINDIFILLIENIEDSYICVKKAAAISLSYIFNSFPIQISILLSNYFEKNLHDILNDKLYKDSGSICELKNKNSLPNSNNIHEENNSIKFIPLNGQKSMLSEVDKNYNRDEKIKGEISNLYICSNHLFSSSFLSYTVEINKEFHVIFKNIVEIYLLKLADLFKCEAFPNLDHNIELLWNYYPNMIQFLNISSVKDKCLTKFSLLIHYSRTQNSNKKLVASTNNIFISSTIFFQI